MTLDRRALLSALGTLLLPVAVVAQPRAAQFEVGQSWELSDGRFPEAQIVVGRIEELGVGPVVHVSVLNVQLPDDERSEVGHMPFTEEALRRSVGRLTGTGVQPSINFEAGYAQWAADRGGVFTITVGEAVAAAFSLLQTPATDQPVDRIQL